MTFYEYRRGKREAPKAAETADGAVDIECHNRRYHPHGFSANTRCKYAQGADEPPAHYHSFASADEAREWLRSATGVECCHIKGLHDFFLNFGPAERLAVQFRALGKPVTGTVYDRACEVFAQTCWDVMGRFGRIPFPQTLFTPYDFSAPPLRWLGSSALDSRDADEPNYISVGNVFNLGLSAFGHSQAEFPYDVTRHEIGHSLATESVMEAFGRMAETWDESQYGGFADYLGRNVSGRAKRDSEEAVADIFSIRFSPAYASGTLAREIENFADGMLVHAEGEAQMAAMDEATRKPRSKKNLPFWHRFSVEPIDQPPEGRIWWYDGPAGYVVFKTEAEMARYAFDRLQIPGDLQRRLFSEFTGAWSGHAVCFVKAGYYDFGKSYDEIVDGLNAMYGAHAKG